MSAMEDYLNTQEYRRGVEGRPVECPECGHEWFDIPTVTCENQDADGNRGIELHCVICPECGEEHCWYGGFC